MKWLIPLGILILFEGIADYYAGKWGENGKVIFAVIAFVGYALGNLSWLIAVKDGSGLARGAIIFSVASALLAVGIGIFIYKEHLTTVQLVGVALGIISIGLIFSSGDF